MNEVKRYDITTDGFDNFSIDEDKLGRFVLLEDYAALQAQLTATTNSLTNAQEALKSAGIEADTVRAGVMELKAQRDALMAENAEVKGIVDGHAAGFKICPQCSHQDECETDDVVWMVRNATPATDAYLNAVRAEGVEMFARQHHAIVAASNSTSFLVHRRFAACTAEQFAAQLRAGNAGKDGNHE